MERECPDEQRMAASFMEGRYSRKLHSLSRRKGDLTSCSLLLLMLLQQLLGSALALVVVCDTK